MVFCACAAWLPVGSAAAFDVALDADTSFQIYEVRSPGARALMARRRLFSRLALRLTHDLTEPEADGRVIRVLAEAQLRFEQDFGETCLLGADLCVNAVDPNNPGSWQPLAADTRLDVPALWVGVSGLPLDVMVRAWRQLVLDTIGFARYDGVSVESAPLRWLRVDAHAGRLVTGTTPGGTPRSDPQGSVRLDADVPWAAPASDIWVAGARLSGGPSRLLMLSLGFRHMWDGHGDVLSRMSAGASSQPARWLRLEVDGVLDLLTDDVIESRGTVTVGEDSLQGYAQLSRHVPRFDPGTIWAWFALAPITQAELGARWTVNDDVSLGGALKGRHADLADAQSDDLDAGVDGWIRGRWEGFRAGFSGFVWSGALGPLAGVSLDVARQFLGFMEIGLDVSLWHFDDPHRPDVFGLVLSEALQGRFRLTPESLVLVELQHATSRLVGHRFRGIVAVRIDTWR